MSLAASLEQFLARTRRRGFSVERMTPSLSQAGPLISMLRGEALAEPVYRATTELLSEITAVVLLPEAASGAPVTSIAAPVLDNRGAVMLNLAAHPFQELSQRDVMAIGRRLVEAAGAITAAADGAAT